MDGSRKKRGLERRKEILGATFVENSLKNVDEFSKPFQELVNEYVWGVAWDDPSLDPKYRSILNLGILAAMGRFQEFETHFRTALRNGLTKKELQAALIHIGIYCGAPVGVECFRSAKKVLEETAMAVPPNRTPKKKK